ncbi:MAG TPA: SDR family NAD(P)-dependent oxidoreductase [Terriglobales bacterium]|nr:SDR family NAD(P)-dependent oxidoreductase [Terriglobales bacterium]
MSRHARRKTRATADNARATQPLSGKIALITGASRGIGFAIAKALADEGCDLVLTARGESALKKASRELNDVRVLAQTCDVRDERSVDSLFKAVRNEFGRLDFLINNAGTSHTTADVDRLSPKVWQDVIATNLTGMFLCTRAALPLMSERAAIVNNLSVAANRVFAGQSAYCASKHGALGFTNTLREEVRGRGIRVIALLVGATDTDIWDQFMPSAPRAGMLRSETIARAVLDALLLPAEATVEEVIIRPTRNAL